MSGRRCVSLWVGAPGARSVGRGARASAAGRARANRRDDRRGRAAARRASAGGHAGAVVEGEASPGVAAAARGARRRAVRGRAWWRRHLPRPGTARRLSDHRSQAPQADLHWYLRQVEEALIDALGELGIAGERNVGYTGVWTEGRSARSRRSASTRATGSRGTASPSTCRRTSATSTSWSRAESRR